MLWACIPHLAPGDVYCVVLDAVSMGAAMFMRALVLAPDLFGPFHVMHNATIGSFPPQIADILTAKGGKLLAYHEVDADHMREAVCYKKLTALMQHAPHLCRYVDNELARAASSASNSSTARRAIASSTRQASHPSRAPRLAHVLRFCRGALPE